MGNKMQQTSSGVEKTEALAIMFKKPKRLTLVSLHVCVGSLRLSFLGWLKKATKRKPSIFGRFPILTHTLGSTGIRK